MSFNSLSYNPLSTAKNLYINGELLEHLVIPESVTTINKYLFANCLSLKSIVLHENVSSIGDFAFYDCKNLTIYSEAVSKQDGWSNSWNASNNEVYYSGEWEYVDGIPTVKFDGGISGENEDNN